MSAFAGTIVIFALAVVAFFIWLFWRIFEKAGFSGALAFLNLIPSVGFLICILILAFSEWPATQRQMGSPGVPLGGPPMAT